jgi:transcriptional regulator GlxA family with amidase domain
MATRYRQTDCRIHNVIRQLSDDPSRTLRELAQGCHVSLSRLSHIFKDETGINVKHYRLGYRLQVAAALLSSTSVSIKEIAFATGYQHSSSFVRAFKTHFGVSPVCYRKQQRPQGM